MIRPAAKNLIVDIPVSSVDDTPWQRRHFGAGEGSRILVNCDATAHGLGNSATVSGPSLVTYNGQKQADFPNTVIKDDLKLPYLDRYLIVHADYDRRE